MVLIWGPHFKNHFWRWSFCSFVTTPCCLIPNPHLLLTAPAWSFRWLYLYSLWTICSDFPSRPETWLSTAWTTIGKRHSVYYPLFAAWSQRAQHLVCVGPVECPGLPCQQESLHMSCTGWWISFPGENALRWHSPSFDKSLENSQILPLLRSPELKTLLTCPLGCLFIL